jgi:hypothetical protein
MGIFSALSIYSGGPDTGKPIEMRVIGLNDMLRKKLAGDIVAFLETREGVKDVTQDVEFRVIIAKECRQQHERISSMISALQQQQLEKYVEEFQSCATESNAPELLQTLVPEFYHFVGGCKVQVEKALERAHDLNEDERKVAEGLLNNLSTLQSSLITTSQQLGIDLEANGHTVTADEQTLELRVNFEQSHLKGLKNTVIQAIRDTLDVEAPLASSRYTVDLEPDHSISIRIIHDPKD